MLFRYFLKIIVSLNSEKFAKRLMYISGVYVLGGWDIERLIFLMMRLFGFNGLFVS
jgi:hypothetical protein